jgi:predicted lipid-binding transport protein (Tim44 family)
MPFLAFLLNPRVLIVLVVVGLLAFTHLTAYRKGSSHVRQEWAAATAQANDEARKLEQQRQRRADEAGALAQAREVGLRAAAVRAAGADDGLRDDLAALRARSQSCAAAHQRADALDQLFGECVSAHRELAQKADRHSSDVKLLLDAWPK